VEICVYLVKIFKDMEEYTTQGRNQRTFSGGGGSSNLYLLATIMTSSMCSKHATFCYDQLTNRGGGIFFIVGAMGVNRGRAKGVCCPPGNLDTNQICLENLKSTV